MSIVLIRIDDRLIHGQVIEGWLKTVHADTILVVSDEVVNDEIQKQLMGLAVPENIKLTIADVKNSVEIINAGHETEERIFVLVPDIETVSKMIELKVEMESLNLGGLHWSQGKTQYMKAVSLDEKEIKQIKEIKKRGIEIESRALPMDDRMDILKFIEEKSEIKK
ncbi:MAG: PTS sugar transporter subunit IIB [Elusimicrobia bacterium]|nr:PTS sugar transporter subunit IIB [Elusimicrobiota bacterium]